MSKPVTASAASLAAFKRASLLLATIAIAAVPTLSRAVPVSRTWVSGVGSDANPCSRAMPCLTFSGAMANTAAGGEIECLDPGHFGSAHITQSLTIDCAETFSGIQQVLGNHVIVDAGAGDIVNLRGLNLNGSSLAGIGLNGIRFIGGHSLYVSRFTIKNYSGWGISVESGDNSVLFVHDSVFENNGSGADSGGILIQPSAGSIHASIERVSLVDNVVGIKASGASAGANGVHLALSECTVASNAGNGVWALRGIGTQTVVLVDNCKIVNNAGTGVLADTGATVLLSRSTIERNAIGANVTGGQLYTYQDNLIDNNLGVDLSAAAVIRSRK